MGQFLVVEETQIMEQYLTGFKFKFLFAATLLQVSYLTSFSIFTDIIGNTSNVWVLWGPVGETNKRTWHVVG